MIPVVIDFETRSRLSLPDTNNYKYARHDSTEVLCLAYEFDGFERELWRPGEPFPFEDDWPHIRFLAFNSEFELTIWNFCCVRRYGWPELRPEQIECLQARCAYAGLPRKLEKVSQSLALGKMGKDMDGHKVTQELCKPKRAKLVGCVYQGGAFVEDEAKHARNEEYCDRDVRAESIVARIAPPLPKAERDLWLVHQRINQRGVPVDVPLLRNMAWMVEREETRLNTELRELSGGRAKTHGSLTKGNHGWDWMRERGAKLPNLKEETLTKALKGGYGELSPEVRRALEIRLLCRNSSVEKFPAMLNHVEADNRCRGAHIFYKAGPGRFAGSGVNFLNLSRISEDDLPELLTMAERICVCNDPLPIYDQLQKSPLGVIPSLARMPRMAVCAPKGSTLIDCDFTSIEYRVLHWMAGDTNELRRIEDFDSGIGEEPYRIGAAAIFNKKVADVTKDERKIGKVQRLGCGYMTGAEKFANFCQEYGIDMPFERAQELVQLYRRSNPVVVNFWYACGKKAIRAIRERATTQIGPVEFYMRGHTLVCRLPSGREMKYYDACLGQGKFGDEIVALDQRSGKRKTVGLPTLIENIDQGISRDILCCKLMKCDAEQVPAALHVYDSILGDVPAAKAESYGRLLVDIMRERVPWAPDLPLNTELKIGRRMT